MKYINKQTGAVVNVNSVLGGAWEPFEATQAKPTETKTKAPAKKKTTKKEA